METEIDIAQLNGCLPSPVDERDHLISGEVSSKIVRPDVCPAPFDLPDINQFSKEETKYACVTCSLSGIRHQLSRMQDVTEEYDYQWLYDQCKLIDGYPGLNGTSLKAALEVARIIGVKTTTGKFRKIKEYKKVINPNDPAQMETAIFLYHGVIAAVTLSNAGWKGTIVRAPRDGEPTGGHGEVLNGYGANNYFGQDSMPSYHGGCIFQQPKLYPINEAFAVVLDEDIVDTALTGWVASDVKNTISGDTIIGRLNLRDSINGTLIKTLTPGTKFKVVGTSLDFIAGHSWQKIEVL